MSEKKKEYILTFKSGDKFRFTDSRTPAVALSTFLGGDDKFTDDLQRFFDDMEIGDIQHLESLTIMCREAF